MMKMYIAGDYHGISIFLPDDVWWSLKDSNGRNYRYYFDNAYLAIDFSKYEMWDDFIKELYGV